MISENHSSRFTHNLDQSYLWGGEAHFEPLKQQNAARSGNECGFADEGAALMRSSSREDIHGGLRKIATTLGSLQSTSGNATQS